jgi:hypothetical protein
MYNEVRPDIYLDGRYTIEMNSPEQYLMFCPLCGEVAALNR